MPQLFVQGQALHTLELSSETTVEALKTTLAVAEGVAAEEQVLNYGGVPLEDECVVFDSVPALATLTMNVRVVGGEYKASVELFLSCTRVGCVIVGVV